APRADEVIAAYVTHSRLQPRLITISRPVLTCRTARTVLSPVPAIYERVLPSSESDFAVVPTPGAPSWRCRLSSTSACDAARRQGCCDSVKKKILQKKFVLTSGAWARSLAGGYPPRTMHRRDDVRRIIENHDARTLTGQLDSVTDGPRWGRIVAAIVG